MANHANWSLFRMLAERERERELGSNKNFTYPKSIIQNGSGLSFPTLQVLNAKNIIWLNLKHDLNSVRLKSAIIYEVRAPASVQQSLYWHLSFLFTFLFLSHYTTNRYTSVSLRLTVSRCIQTMSIMNHFWTQIGIYDALICSQQQQ